jgi:hypothetical protein
MAYVTARRENSAAIRIYYEDHRDPGAFDDGDHDRILPCEATGRRFPALLKNARSAVIAAWSRSATSQAAASL